MTCRDLFEDADGVRRPKVNGPLDLRLGTSNKRELCGTCGLPAVTCAGHFGHIALELPVYHVGFLKATIEVLQAICKTCSRVLLSEEAREPYVRAMRKPGVEGLKRNAIRKRALAECKKVAVCPWCHGVNGLVKRVTAAPTFRVVHDRSRFKGAVVESAAEAFSSSLVRGDRGMWSSIAHALP